MKQESGTIRFQVRGVTLQTPSSLIVTSPDQDHVSKLHDFVACDSNGLLRFFQVKCPSGIVSEEEAARNLNSYWVTRGEVLLFRNCVAHELFWTRNALCSLHHHRAAASGHRYTDDQLLTLISNLLNQLGAWKLRIHFGLLCQVFQLVQNDQLREAHALLTTAFQRALVAKEARLQRRLRVLSKLLACFNTLWRASFSIRAVMATQRAWFLHHGAHPTDALLAA